MNATRRPIPAHGTYARGNGSPGLREPCTCKPCHEAKLRTRKRLNIARLQGRGARIDATATREHLKRLHTTMSWTQIAQATGCDPRGMQLIISGQRTEINRSTQTKILAVKPAATPAPGMYIDAVGLRRRIQALSAIGYSCIYLADRIGTAEVRLHRIANGSQPSVRWVLASRIIAIYNELSHTPAPAGRSRTRVIRHAAANRWAAPVAWDDDTIDDPNAVPDWTGFCGTDRGWWTHRQQDVPVCPACENAHAEWKQARQHLSRSELMTELTAARANAAGRGEAIVHDGRELLAQGLSHEQAAERLGITRAYLLQELGRRPEITGEQVAA